MNDRYASQIGQRASGTYDGASRDASRDSGYLPLTGRQHTGKAATDLAHVEASVLMECLCSAIADGCGVTFSATSDGGALSVTLLRREGRFRDYAAGTEAITSALLAVRDLCLPREGRDTPAPSKRAR